MNDASGILSLLDPVIDSADEGQSKLRFTVKPQFTIPGGVVQGGIVSAMLDMAMAIAGNGAISTVSLHVEILRPVVGPELDVVGRIVRSGRRIVFAEAEMRDPEGTLVASGRQTAVPIS